MKRFLTMILPCLLFATALAAGSSRFDRANERFAAGDFAQAAELYQEVIDAEGPSAAALFNFGNCEQRLGKYGPAILAYERARLLTPRDPDLRANLALARKSAAVFEEPGRFPRVDAFFEFPSLNEWSWIVAGGALFLGGLAVLRGAVGFSKRWLVAGVRSTAIVAALLVALGAVALYLRRGEKERGVTLSDNATVRLSPFEAAESLGTTGPGRIVRILKTDGAFHYVAVPGTTLQGWMSDKDVAAILPSMP
jgi:tetratricopeptide (TPR) repeat protein